MSNLFQLGDFTLASGAKSNFKIECDALRSQDWDCLAELLVKKLPPFSEVRGVPRGGLELQYRLKIYAEPQHNHIVYVDDVWTTGESMFNFISGHQPDPVPQ